MRFFAFILAVLVLGLSVVPCADATAMHEKTCKYEVAKETKKDKSPANDACSPFCQCACCAGFTINHFAASISTIQFLSNRTTDSFLPSETIEVVLPIWQPPQLG